jgi:hypothetical protein
MAQQQQLLYPNFNHIEFIIFKQFDERFQWKTTNLKSLATSLSSGAL